MTIHLKKSIVSLSIVSSLILLTGCANNMSTVQKDLQENKKVSFPELKKSAKIYIADNYYIKNGVLELNDGSRIFDEEADIKDVFKLKNQLYYTIYKGDKLLIKEATTKNVIKDFNCASWKIYEDEGEVFLAILFNGNRTPFYDNLYNFDGTSFKMINKNVNIGSTSINDRYVIQKVYYKDGSKAGIKIIDIETMKEINYKPKDTKNKDLIGIAGDKFYFIETSGFIVSVQYALKVYDARTKETKTILSGDSDFPLIQILEDNNTTILKVFTVNGIKPEGQMHGHYENMTSKYGNMPARYINLNTLEEINEPKGFNIKHLYNGFDNLGGGYTKTTYITYDLGRIYYSLSDKGYIPIF